MNIEKVKNKIKKLLALASSPNAAEAELAMEKCNELMEKYDIRHIDIDEKTNKIGVEVSTVAGYHDEHDHWESKLGAAIADCFDAIALVHEDITTDGWRLSFVAAKTDTEFVTHLYLNLRRTISKMAKQYVDKVHTSKINRRRILSSYRIGMTDTIYQRLSKLYKALPDTKALVPVKKKAIEDTIQEMFGSIKERSPSTISDENAFRDGMLDGNNVGLNRPIENSKGQRSLS